MGATKRRRDYEELRDVSAGCDWKCWKLIRISNAGCEGAGTSVWDEWKKGRMK